MYAADRRSALSERGTARRFVASIAVSVPTRALTRDAREAGASTVGVLYIVLSSRDVRMSGQQVHCSSDHQVPRLSRISFELLPHYGIIYSGASSSVCTHISIGEFLFRFLKFAFLQCRILTCFFLGGSLPAGYCTVYCRILPVQVYRGNTIHTFMLNYPERRVREVEEPAHAAETPSWSVESVLPGLQKFYVSRAFPKLCYYSTCTRKFLVECTGTIVLKLYGIGSVQSPACTR